MYLCIACLHLPELVQQGLQLAAARHRRRLAAAASALLGAAGTLHVGITARHGVVRMAAATD